MIERVGITFNPGKKDILAKVEFVVRWLEKRKIKVFVPGESGADRYFGKNLVSIEEIKKAAQLIVSLGGDGTLCKSAREFSRAGIPILGINLGGLGFLTEAPINKFEEKMEKILSNEYTVEHRMMLQAKIICKNFESQTFIALNDVVISKSFLPRIVSLNTFVSGDFVTTYSADGLIISTPTGSTAYSLSAGGPIVHPSLKVIILSPICAHTLAVRPLIVSQEETIRIVPETPSEDIFLTIDGQEAHSIKKQGEVEVKKSPYQAKLIRFKGRSFFEVLQTKLGWSGVTYKTDEQ